MDGNRYRQHAHIPIPTYDEAISRPASSSRDHRGPGEISDDAERQGLLEPQGPPSGQQPPTVESPRSSEDSDLQLPEVTARGDVERRQIEELDYLDPSSPNPDRRHALYHRPRLRSKFSQRLSNLGATLSSIRIPSIRSLYLPVSSGAAPETPSPPQGSFLRRAFERVPTVPDQLRISLPNAARLFGLLIIGILVWSLFALDIFPGRGRRARVRYDPESVRVYVQDHIDGNNIAGYLRHITMYDHVAGTEGDLYMAEWMRERWMGEGQMENAVLTPYYVYLNYPKSDGTGRSVKIVSPPGQKWTARLEEETVDRKVQQTLAWHGHSKSGEAEGHLVYANGGSREDFQWLKEQGVELNGSIALMRYYSTQGDRALKIKAAEEAGCVGALIYSDPIDDGSGKGAVWPEGPWRPDDSLQRGGVSLMSWVVGDPLTPGYPSSERDTETVPIEGNPGLNGIPSLPLAWRDAAVLLSSLREQGVKVPADWVGGDKKSAKDWFSGASTADAPVVHLENFLDESPKQPIWNLNGVILGQESPEKRIIVGNHRDAWCFGSVDPGSGSAILMEVVSIFGQLQEHGWQPLRTIEFASWDAEEYNLVGSTEFVEDQMDALRANAYAYLNVDVGVYGPNPVFRAAGSPVWQKPLLHVLGRVNAPGSNSTLLDLWHEANRELEGLGAGSDYVAFQDMAGTSSIDFGFEGADHGYPYHSCLETMEWMEKFGDPDFEYHRALAQVWALLILEVADRPLLPFDLRIYADAIRGPYLDTLQTYAESVHAEKFDLTPLRHAADAFAVRAEAFHKFEDEWTVNVLGAGGFEARRYGARRMQYNDAISNFERDLLDLPASKSDKGPHGVPGREQFKHVVFGPQAWSGYDEAYFPAVRDALERGDWAQAQKMVDKAARIMTRAVENLEIDEK